MSRITEDEIRSLGELSRLALSDAEVVQMQRDLQDILEHMDALAEAPTEGVLPMTHVLGAARHLRPDEVLASLPTEEVLAACPSHTGSCFDVPAILPAGSKK